jgi:hypothetical protein
MPNFSQFFSAKIFLKSVPDWANFRHSGDCLKRAFFSYFHCWPKMWRNYFQQIKIFFVKFNKNCGLGLILGDFFYKKHLVTLHVDHHVRFWKTSNDNAMITIFNLRRKNSLFLSKTHSMIFFLLS